MLSTVLQHVNSILADESKLDSADPELATFLLDTIGSVVLPTLNGSSSADGEDEEKNWEAEFETHLAVRPFLTDSPATHS